VLFPATPISTSISTTSIEANPTPPGSQALLPSPSINAPVPSALPPPPCRIYIGSIRWDVSETDIRNIFSAFGPIKSLNLVPNTENGKHKGYGFIEYMSPQSAEVAIAKMNGAIVAGRAIKVGMASGITVSTFPLASLFGGTTAPSFLDSTISASVNAAIAMATKVSSGTNQDSISAEENLTISGPQQRAMIMQILARDSMKVPTLPRTMVLRNMVSPGDVDEELKEDVSSECSKFGLIENVVIHEQPPENGLAAVVKIFVTYKGSESTTIAISAMNGRWFGGRQVIAEYYDDKRVELGDFKG